MSTSTVNSNNGVKVYLAQKMTGRYADEVLHECQTVKYVLEKVGFIVLSPVMEEGVKEVHEIIQASSKQLQAFWKRDKEMLQECHIMFDFNSQGMSDGVNVEMGYTRFCMWKPLVRFHPTIGPCISKIEYDCVMNDIEPLVWTMLNMWGTKRKLFWWRIKMLIRCVPKFIYFQLKFLGDCI